ncbi:MAG TPA: hypothetical protein VKQ31_09825, partial [Steroidobacteraceae bacterium]|nr:hypothetical protein [Steroidobacteraceae bacterium]
RNIERAIGKRLPRVTLPGFDYAHKPAERFEIPIGERIAAIRARKAEERARAREKAARREAHAAAPRRAEPQHRSEPHAPRTEQPPRSPLSRTHRRGR